MQRITPQSSESSDLQRASPWNTRLLGIRINAVCPGVVETPMFRALTEKTPDAMKEVMRDQPIGRLGRPEEIAAAVLWLCSSAASFIVGAALEVDGGFTAH